VFQFNPNSSSHPGMEAALELVQALAQSAHLEFFIRLHKIPVHSAGRQRTFQRRHQPDVEAPDAAAAVVRHFSERVVATSFILDAQTLSESQRVQRRRI